MKLYIKYQRPGPSGYNQEDFKGFPYIRPYKHVVPGRGHFWPKGYNLNNLGRGLLDEATYQISKTWAFWFQSRRFLKVFLMLVYLKHVCPWAGPIFTPGL